MMVHHLMMIPLTHRHGSLVLLVVMAPGFRHFGSL
jgi:hypothetical protein